MNIKIVLPLAHRVHVADAVIEALNAQTVPSEVVLLAQTVEAGEYAAASGLEWEMGETGAPGDRYSFAAMAASQPDYWAFCDDDALYAPDYLERALESHTRPVFGWWAFNLKRQESGWPKSYHSRVEISKVGKPADFLGSCGLVAEASVVRACGKCPPVCRWVDDLWFCGRAQSLGYRLEKGAGDITFLPEVKDEHTLSLSPELQSKDVLADYWLHPFVSRPT